MKSFDRYLQKKRINHALKYIKQGDSVLDIGCDEGTLFKNLGNNLGKGIGVDPTLKNNIKTEKYELISGNFPRDLKTSQKFNAITMLAVIEHFPNEVLEGLDENCAHFLADKGKVIITAPSVWVDHILEVLLFFKIIDGMSLEEHHGFKPNDTLGYFSKNFKLIKRKKFQLGLNNLFVFEKK